MSFMRMPRRAWPQTAQEAFMPPPLAGLTTTAPAAECPPTKALYLKNLIPAEMGLRARLGYLEWVTGVDTASAVTGILPFNAADPSNSRLFAVTADGIWDVSESTTTPDQVATFEVTTDLAGYGSCHVMVTAAGHWLCYCDEENGYWLYGESTETWQQVVSSDQTAWTGTHGYSAGEYVTNDGGNVYLCTQSGTSAGSGGPTGTGVDIDDGSCKWDFNFSVSGVDPEGFVFVVAWKGRLWFVDKASASAWYLDVSSVAGEAIEFPLGNQFRAGGFLVGLWNWTTDGGAGVDDYFVAISSGGDVVVYQGTDPASAATFVLSGVWTVGALPAGRQIATDLGGDLVIASMLGLVPLSQLVVGKLMVGDRSQYLTADVQNLFNNYTALYGQNQGWQLRLDPKDNALLILVPLVEGVPTTQLAMSLATRGWFPYAGLPMNCAAQWNGTLYFGTTDGRVCAHDGDLDGTTFAGVAGNPVQWGFISGFSALGAPRKKQLGNIRPRVMSQSGAVAYTAEARYDFDLTPPPTVSAATGQSGPLWDSAIWDTSVWSGEFVESEMTFGAAGIGTHVALAIAGCSNSRTILLGAEATYTTGGFL